MSSHPLLQASRCPAYAHPPRARAGEGRAACPQHSYLHAYKAPAQPPLPPPPPSPPRVRDASIRRRPPWPPELSSWTALPVGGRAGGASTAGSNATGLLAFADGEPIALRWGEVIPLSFFEGFLNRSSAQVIVWSMPTRRYVTLFPDFLGAPHHPTAPHSRRLI